MNELKNPDYFWRSHEQLAREFGQEGVDPTSIRDGWSRRSFLGVMGASAALAGVGLSGCIRKPVEHITPFAKRPEDLIPGKPVFYATAVSLGMAVTRLVVESQDGRPTKVEGMPRAGGKPRSGGNDGPTDHWTQASVLDLYDPERSSVPGTVAEGKQTNVSWADAYKVFDTALAESRKKGGRGLAFVVDTVMSPSYRKALTVATSGRLGAAKLYVADPAYPHNRLRGAELVSAPKTYSRTNVKRATIIAAFDSDFLHSDGEWLENARGYGQGRRQVQKNQTMNRVYVVEPLLTVTGSNADHRIRTQASNVGTVLQAVAARLFTGGVTAPKGGPSVTDAKFDNVTEAIINALVDDLKNKANRGRAVIIVGERQPAWVHALGHYVNEAIGAHERGLASWHKGDLLTVHKLSQLTADLNEGKVDTVVCMGTNPVYVASGDLGFGDAYQKAAKRIHLGLHFDETAKISSLHIPISHYLEAWGDLQSLDGAVTVVQPLIAPLFHTPSLLEVAARAADGTQHKGRDLVDRHLFSRVRRASVDKKTLWRKWLFDGRVTQIGAPVSAFRGPLNWSKLQPEMKAPEGSSEGFELNFQLDSSMFDGRFATNGWLQELPDPITKLTWDNAAMFSSATAKANNLKNGDMVTISWDGRSATLPVWIVPGTADNSIGLPLGYGRSEIGTVAENTGFNTYTLQRSGGGHNPWFGRGATFTTTGTTYTLATVQHHDSLTPLNAEKPGTGPGTNRRPLIRVADKAYFNANPDFVNDSELIKDKTMIRSLSTRPQDEPDVYQAKQQWGLTIDLNTCLGCNACMIACQAENNIPVVGKDRVLMGREMSWIRLDRYFEGMEGDPNPLVVVQPVPCQQCENAPCETVCPVAATTHSPDGLNDMAYNRCIGTRYCANNCPYKVRRFNYFNFNLDIHPLQKMQKNPDVTIRFRGVMEKCTYCIQRISEAKIDAKVRGNGLVPDIVDPKAKSKTIMTACQQACPTGSIVFGDIRNPRSKVSQVRADPRRYELLSELNTRPRTCYLAKIRNPHPALAFKAGKKG